MKAQRARGLIFATFLASGLVTGCETLGLQSDTAVVDDERYLFMRPWTHYEVSGSGPPMLLVHGFPGDLGTWEKLVDPLAKYFEVFRIDLAGFGGSVNPYRNYDLEFYSAQIASFIREMELGPTIVVGHSTGGAATLDAFLRYPEEIQSIVLLNSAGFDVPGPDLEEDLDRMGRSLHNYQGESDMEQLVATVIETPLKKLYTDEKFFDAAEVRRLARGLDSASGRRAHLETLRNLKPHDVVGRVMAKSDELRLHSKSERRGERDILVVWGAKDPWFPPRMAEYFRARIPGAKVAIIQDSGHFVHVEQPETVAGLIVDVMLPRPVADNRFSITNYDADYLIERGRTYKRRKEWAKALKTLNQALERNPYLGLAYYEIGDLLFQQQQFAEALEMLYRSLDIYPDNAAVHHRMGTTFHNQATELIVRLRKQGTDEETIADITQAKMLNAVKSYERAAELDPSKPNPWYNLGRIYTDLKDWDNAARVYGGLATADPSNPRNHRLQVDALLKAADLPGAAEALQRLAKVERNNAQTHAMLGRVRRDTGDLDGAIAAFEQAVSLNSRDEEFPLDLALVYLRKENYDEALSNTQRVLQRNPGNPRALLLRARLRIQSKEWTEAASDYERSLKSDKKSFTARLGAARARLMAGDYGKVLSLLEPLLGAAEPPREPLIYLTAARAQIRALPLEITAKGRARRKALKRMEGVMNGAADLLARAVANGHSPEGLKQDGDFKRMKKNKRFKAVTKLKALDPDDLAPRPFDLALPPEDLGESAGLPEESEEEATPKEKSADKQAQQAPSEGGDEAPSKEDEGPADDDDDDDDESE